MTANALLADLVEHTELAAEISKHPRTISRWSNQPGGLPFIKIGNKRFYHVPTVRDWILSRTRNADPRRAGVPLPHSVTEAA